ncbi:3-phosphoshikimate 1-carboxyvinyltransferase [Enterococcus raffinosus]|uniref:3-phosphoshikimate 1-carboxyvinyltransferase n=2 Tax=Enterococcus raffinosus TaxID=71452 RepID=R2P7Z8_9ENTE|nr:3-phosphoshikimate 1-carboxyvinyltransferase [Enterococcus raffinosus]EOH80392.1 3-phosphoshikimate 1-carboxyvinyltransferase [Enterococcus raffinosus ATCC 49464]EOT71178.1 3-phosphoshikimate 1-carboxyvinyltransferase [Enterococcus raffinosus ATCC 49464]OJG87689.1 3-phosphoshikimate 1-carboxyvinyltransferase [Enterococcus raffinosus]UXK05730.1 3-phosphoshikimate 1-carboxyvinyltransferase [Enterococcus raffinosus]GMS54751.1 3-phosphoshikimate 1-carboxyvinyltransferase [Enterococcus raffinosu
MKLLKNKSGLSGTLTVPADKSISHRSIMFGAISHGKTTIHNFLRAEDCLSTVAVFKALGVTIDDDGEVISIEGKGFKHLQAPQQILDAGNSGTTMRLVLGILAGQTFHSKIAGDASLNRRPMERVMGPLRMMGGNLQGEQGSEFPPIEIEGGPLSAITYEMPIASAQVKSAILFAALQAEGLTTIIEKEKSRNHTEEMIKQFGGNISVEDKTITVSGGQQLVGQEVTVPGDISSAAFYLVAATLLADSDLQLKHVGINPTRTGILDVLQEMGADIQEGSVDSQNQAADLQIKAAPLKAVEIKGEIIPRLIDELPVIALAATQAEGTTVIRDAEELKVKETNRIDATAQELNKLGANIETTEDGLIIHGPTPLHGGTVDSHGDHRIGMMLQIAALLTDDIVELNNPEAINISYPNFFNDLASLI